MFANITQENHLTLHDPDCYVYGNNCKVPTNMIIKHNRNLNGGLFDLQNMQLFIKKNHQPIALIRLVMLLHH